MKINWKNRNAWLVGLMLGTAFLAEYLHSSQMEISYQRLETERYAHLRTFKIEEAEADAKAAIKAKDFRLMAVNGYTVETPGVTGDISKQVTLRAEHGIKIIGGTSDTESGPDGVAFNNDARLYAKNYNKVILSAPAPASK